MTRKTWDWDALSADYALYHKDARNKLCHMLGIPMIVFCVVRWTQFGGSTFPLAAFALPVYVYWDPALGLAMTAVIALMAAAAPHLPVWAFPAMFFVGWVLQFVGHNYEGKKPAFTENALHLLVGPFWILREATVAKFLR